MTTVKEQVQDALLGTTEGPQLSQQTRAEFMKHAITDSETGEHYLGEDQFINAIAPQSEDYVSHSMFKTVQDSYSSRKNSIR